MLFHRLSWPWQNTDVPHVRHWYYAGRPELAAWQASAAPLPPPAGPPQACRIGPYRSRAITLKAPEKLTPVRAFYLDLSQWALEDPGRWARWVAPCPVGQEEISQRKFQRHRKARMDARTRERLPVLPVLVRTVDERRLGCR